MVIDHTATVMSRFIVSSLRKKGRKIRQASSPSPWPLLGTCRGRDPDRIGLGKGQGSRYITATGRRRGSACCGSAMACPGADPLEAGRSPPDRAAGTSAVLASPTERAILAGPCRDRNLLMAAVRPHVTCRGASGCRNRMSRALDRRRHSTNAMCCELRSTDVRFQEILARFHKSYRS